MAGNSGLDLLSALWTNTLLSVVFLICFALLKNQPLNFRVYFPKLYVRGEDEKVKNIVEWGNSKGKLGGYVNLSWKSYLRSFNWMWYALKDNEHDLIGDVGLDGVVLIRIFLLGLKIFIPMLVWGFAVLIPVNKTDSYLAQYHATHQNDTSNTITYDENSPESLSIANVEDLSKRLWAHLLAAYLFTGWTLLMLYIEYETVERMRFQFLASQTQRPEQFTVLVRQVPKDNTKSVGLRLEHFFQENHHQHYLTHQVVYKANRLTKLLKKKKKCESKLERWQDQLYKEPSMPRPVVKVRKQWFDFRGKKSDVLEAIAQLDVQIRAERKRVLSDDRLVMRAGFVSFDCRWGAAVCAQTQQSRDHTKWLTEWAPEPRDVYWDNLAINYLLLNSRKLLVTVVSAVLVIFFLLAVGAVQVLANLDELIKYLPFLKPLSKWKYLEAFVSGFVPGLVLKLFLLVIPFVLTMLTRFEGHVSYSQIEKYAGIKYFAFLVVNVFFGNVLIGSLFDQLKTYVAAPTTIPNAFGVAIPKKATFFMTYIMIDGWTSIAAEVMRLFPLLGYHFMSLLFVRTDRERVKVIPATPCPYIEVLPRLSLYILLGLVYAVISPLILPFLCVFFAFGFLIYRNQVIYVYEPKYESAASYWPSIHRNVIIGLIINHITLIGLFSVKKAFASTPFLVPLPFLTILFHLFCSQKFYPAFKNYPLQEANIKDKEAPIGSLHFLQEAYLHPSIVKAPKDSDSDDDDPDTVKNGKAPGTGRNNDTTAAHKRNDSVTEPSLNGGRDNIRRRSAPTSKTNSTTVSPAGSLTTVSPAGSLTTVSPAGSLTTVSPAGSLTTVSPAASLATGSAAGSLLGSSHYYDAGSQLSTPPGLSRESSQESSLLPQDDMGVRGSGRKRSRPNRSSIDEELGDIERPQLGSQKDDEEARALEDKEEAKRDRERGREKMELHGTGTLLTPLGHEEP